MDEENLKTYKSGMEAIEQMKASIKEQQQELEERLAPTRQKIKDLQNDLDELKNVISAEAEAEYRQTSEKKLLGGIGIRVGSRLEYDIKTAMEWARTHSPILIQEVLDSKAFEKLAKDHLDSDKGLDFVSVDETITVTFPKEIKLDESS